MMDSTYTPQAHASLVRVYSAKTGVKGWFGKAPQWKTRWCHLHHGQLSAFKSPGNTNARWKFCTQGAEARQLFADDEHATTGMRGGWYKDLPEDERYPFLLGIFPKAAHPVVFACENEEDMGNWIAAIEKHGGTGGAADTSPRAVPSIPTHEQAEFPSQTWNARCQAALDHEASGQPDPAVADVVGHFIAEAQRCVITIVDEYFSPRESQKFPSLLQSDFSHHGYQLEEGLLKSLYFENDVLYRILNVPPEADAAPDFLCSKAVSTVADLTSQELLGARLYRNGIHCDQLRTPLMVMISYAGFWVSAVAVLPISSGSEVYSVVSGARDQSFQTLLQSTMAHCGFGSHPVGKSVELRDSESGLSSNSDVTSESQIKQQPGVSLDYTSTGADVTGYRGEDGRFYLTNLQRVCPADVWIGGSAAANLAAQFTTTRSLRPELVHIFWRECGTLLSSNSYRPLGHLGTKERATNEEYDWQATRASRYLRETVIPRFMTSLNSIENLPCSGSTLTIAMHAAGINMRYLGILAEHALVPHVYDLLVVEMVARQAKKFLKRHILRRQLAVAPNEFSTCPAVSKLAVQRWQQQQEQVRRDAAVEYFQLLLGGSLESEQHWENALSPAVTQAYGIKIDRRSVQWQALACEVQSAFGIELCQTAETLSFALRKEAQASGAVKCGNEAVACDARNKMRDDNGRKATLGFDGAVAVKPGNDGRQLESDAVGLFRKWNLVVKQPWIDFPFSIQHTLLSCHDLDTATVHPRGKLTSQFQNRGGTCFPEECVSVARNGPVSRNMLTLCRQCLRKDAQLRLVGNIALAAAAIGNFDEALLLIEEAEVQLVRGRDAGEVGRLLLVIAHVHFTAGAAEAARQYCLKGVQATISHWGPHHPLLLELYGLLAELATLAGDHRGCLAHRQACLAVATAALGLQHLATACYANAVGEGCLQLSTGDTAEAVGHHARALSTFETKLGRVHPGTAACAYYLAVALSRAGKHASAAAVAKAGCECRRTLLKNHSQSTHTTEEASVLLARSLVQVIEISEARREYPSALDAFQELVNVPVSNYAAGQLVQRAAAATLRVCLRTQIPLELAAVVQATPALSPAAAAAEKLFGQGCIEGPNRTLADQRQHALLHVAICVARQFCLRTTHDPPKEYLLLLTREAGVGKVGVDCTNTTMTVGEGQPWVVRRQCRTSAASMELGCIRAMLANDARASELVEIAARGLAAELSGNTIPAPYI